MKKISLDEILSPEAENTEKKVGYATIIGRPNAWKSTFINQIIGEKIAITSNIPQTTRNKITAIYNDDNMQIIFLDTPGVHESSKSFNEHINAQALGSIKNADVILYFIDSTRQWGTEEKFLSEVISQIKDKKIFRVFTKSDHPRSQLGELWENDFAISSVKHEGFHELLSAIAWELHSGPLLFPEEYYTQQPLRFRIAEIIREKLFEKLKDELPHSIFVTVEEIEDTKNGLRRISAYVYSETESQKYIIIWKNGSLISTIWKEARLELEEIFNMRVFLSLRAKVKKWWKKDEIFLKKLIK